MRKDTIEKIADALRAIMLDATAEYEDIPVPTMPVKEYRDEIARLNTLLDMIGASLKGAGMDTQAGCLDAVRYLIRQRDALRNALPTPPFAERRCRLSVGGLPCTLPDMHFGPCLPDMSQEEVR